MPNISTMLNFPFWLQQDLHSIYQFWKQPTSIPYSLFSAVKRNLFIHSKFHINFFFSLFRRNRNNIFPPIKLPELSILTNQRTTNLTNQRTTRNFLYFLYFCIKYAQSWTALFRAFSSHRQPSAIFFKGIPS